MLFTISQKAVHSLNLSSESGTTEKHLPYQLDIVSSNPDNTTAICHHEPREQNWLCSLGGRDGMLSLMSITVTLSHETVRSYMRSHIALSIECPTLPCNAA